MRCKFCNAEISDDARFCPMCGTVIHGQETDGTDGQGKVSLEKNGGEIKSDNGGYRYGMSGQSTEQWQQGSYDSQGSRYGQYSELNQYGQSGSGYDRYGQYSPQSEQKPINGTLYMIFSVLALLMCCLPLGIASIIFSSKINAQQKSGDYAGARESARIAKILLIVSLVAGIIMSAVVVGLLVADGKLEDNKNIFSSSLIEDGDDEEDSFSGGEDGMEGDLDSITDNNIKAAAPVSELGSSWNTYTVQVNDRVVALPCEYKELEAAGLKINREMWMSDEEGTVSGRGYTLGYLKNEEGDTIVVDFINPDEKAKKAEECLVGGITAYDFDLRGKLKIIFPGNIQMGMSKQDVIGKYGETEDVYEGEQEHMYTWYGEESYYSSVIVSFDSKSEKVSGLYMKNYGE